MTDEQQIDYTLSEMLGAWQLGDVEKLHKDTRMTLCRERSGLPGFRWNNYLAVYQQHTRAWSGCAWIAQIPTSR